MKNILKYALIFTMFSGMLAGCTDIEPERVNIQHPEEQSPIVRDNAYYQRLREYKQTKHKIAFGWYGTWTAMGPSYQTRLTNVPDSMDIVSIWGPWSNLSEQQMKDKETIQTLKGTKVTFTIFAHEVPAQFLDEGQVTPEGLARYAKAYAKDSMDKYRYDGIDLDYEPEWGGRGPLVDGVSVWQKPLASRVYNSNMTIFVKELSKWVGPASGTGKLLLIDGVPYGVEPELAPLFDYGIVQSYASTGYTDLQNRFTYAYQGGWMPEQFIFTENFESYWKNGGVSHTTREGVVMPSLLGMALFNPTQGEGAGFGAYHMEYEYGHSDMPYKYMRQAIQLANPAPQGDFSKNLVSIVEAPKVSSFEVSVTPSGAVFGEASTTLTARLSKPAAKNSSIKLKVDNTLVSVYNSEYGTEYLTADAANVIISGNLVVDAGSQRSAAPVTVSLNNLAQFEDGEYLIPVRLDLSGDTELGIDEYRHIKYITVNKLSTQIAVSLSGTSSPPTYTIMSLIGGGSANNVSDNITASLSLPAISNINFNLVADNSLVEAYNTKHSTSYGVIPVSNIAFSGAFGVAEDATASTASVTVTVTDPDQVPSGLSLIAVRPDLSASSLGDYTDDEAAGIKYIIVYKGDQNVASSQNLDVFDTDADKIDNTGNPLGWVLDILNLGSAGGTGVWNLDNNQMFNGRDGSEAGWNARINNTYSWPRGVGGKLTLDMKQVRQVHTMFWIAYNNNANYSVKTIKDISISVDGETWIPQSSGDVTVLKSNHQWITFVNPVEARYIRMVITDGHVASGTLYCGMKELEIWSPK